VASSTKPRRKYRPRTVAANPVALAIRRAGKIPAAEISEVMAPILASFRAMREGVATEDQWCVLAGSVELALSIEHQGVIRGLQGHLRAAESALAGIQKRAMNAGAWRPTALYFQEIAALDEFTWLHKVQLEQLSEGEFHRAYERAKAVVLSAGGRAVDIRELQVDVQPQLQLHEEAAS
jgi:hypothetical protein